MRSRASFIILFFVITIAALPLFAHANSIPFFGPIIPKPLAGGSLTDVCPAGWGMLIIVINNIILVLLTLAIVFVAPLMIAYSGFLLVVNPFNAGAVQKAKDIMTHTVVGIVVALAAWLIVDMLMAVLYNTTDKVSDGSTLKTWSSIISSGGQAQCLDQKGSLPGASLTPGSAGPGGVVVVPPGTCPAPLSQMTDPLALQMEAGNGNAVIWNNTNAELKPCADKFIGLVRGGTVTSAYRPQSYQTHLWEIHDRWCDQKLQSNTNSACADLKAVVSREVNVHGLSACGAVAKSASTHGSGVGIDISLPGKNYSDSSVIKAASDSCLDWPNYSGDPVHYNLKPGCSCQ